MVDAVVVLDGGGPVDTTMFTVEPRDASVPAVGVVLMTLPAATVDEACDVVVTRKPFWPSWFDAVV